MAEVKHPLESIVMDYAVTHKEFDILDIIPELCGASVVSPPKGMKAYRVVAADVLCILVKQGKLVKRGAWMSKRCPEKGGPVFSLPPAPKKV